MLTTARIRNAQAFDPLDEAGPADHAQPCLQNSWRRWRRGRPGCARHRRPRRRATRTAAWPPRRARKHDEAEKVLEELSSHLKAVRRHFGYRSAREVLAFVDAGANAGLDEAALRDALDQAVSSKVLPRIRGDESEQLNNALEKSKEVCAAAGLARSERKLDHIWETLRTTGLTRF